jgi:hypothetical protein
LGGKGYKSYTSLTGKKVSGDWEDSDRGAGNKATKRAGGKVEKKSPTYKAHVLNKEEIDPTVQNALDELNRYGKETGKATGSLNKKPGTPVKKGGTSSPVMQAVRTKIRQETGKPAGQQKKVRGDKSSTETTPVDRIKKSLADKRAAQKDPSQGRYPKG